MRSNIPELAHFDAKKVSNNLICWIRTYAESSNMRKVVLGVSGGKDSTVAAALCVKALGAENVMGLLMPNGVQSDISDSIRVCEILGIKYKTKNIISAYNAEVALLEEDGDIMTHEALVNLPPRIRMQTLYTWGQSYGHRVCGTGNASEAYVGYTTKFGDMACDFNPLRAFTSLEVQEIGIALGLPEDLVYKTPSDGLCGMSDEEKLGVSYLDIHRKLRGFFVAGNVDSKINKLHQYSRHKFEEVPYFEYIAS